MIHQLRNWLTIITAAASFAPVVAQETSQQTEVFTVDVAEDGTSFVFANAAISKSSLSSYGDSYLTRGYRLYLSGRTLSDGVSGAVEDGNPAFPDKVIGKWTRWGYRVSLEAAHPRNEFATTVYELFDFSKEHGVKTVLLSGVIPAAPGAPMSVLHGSHPYACGNAEQEVLKFDRDLSSFQMRYTFRAKSCSGR